MNRVKIMKKMRDNRWSAKSNGKLREIKGRETERNEGEQRKKKHREMKESKEMR